MDCMPVVSSLCSSIRSVQTGIFKLVSSTCQLDFVWLGQRYFHGWVPICSANIWQSCEGLERRRHRTSPNIINSEVEVLWCARSFFGISNDLHIFVLLWQLSDIGVCSRPNCVFISYCTEVDGPAFDLMHNSACLPIIHTTWREKIMCLDPVSGELSWR